MNGYANHETYSLALWLHNIEYTNNELLPSLLDIANGCKYEAGKMLQGWVENETHLAALVGKTTARDILKDVGSLWRVAWHELFE